MELTVNTKEEYRNNTFTLKCINIAGLIYSGAWLLNVAGIFIIDSKIMNTGMIGTILFLISGYIVGHTAGLNRRCTKYLLLFILIAMLTFVTSMLSYHTTMFMIFPMIYSVQYHNKRVSQYIYILTCIGFFVSVFLGFRVGVCDANMLLLTTGTSAFHIEQLKSGEFLINTNYFQLFLFYVFPRCMILTAVVPLQNYIVNEIQNKTIREMEARRMMEIDGLTGLYNRNKYLQMMTDHYSKSSNVAVIYCDINNLKTTNDSMGHEYGDLLITGMADVLKDFRSEQIMLYRIGGDEFIAIIDNPQPGQAEKIARQIRREAVGKDVGQGVSLSVAIGVAQGAGINAEQVISKADERMYKEKANIKGS